MILRDAWRTKRQCVFRWRITVRVCRQEELEKLNAKLQEPIASEKESYGLKNLSQRIRLFYGDGYGLQLHNNLSGGLTLEMRVAPIFCREAGQGSRS